MLCKLNIYANVWVAHQIYDWGTGVAQSIKKGAGLK